MHSRMVFALAASLAAATAERPEWDRFRGPNGSGVATVKDLPAKLSKTENLVWRTEIGPGYSSPVLGEKCVFLTVHEDAKLFTVCLDRKTGAVAWKQLSGERQGKPRSVNTPVSPTPVTDGRNVWVFFEDAGLVAYDGAGKERWRKDLGKFNNPYGMAASPVLSGKTLILQADQDTNSFLLGLDAATGKQIWKTDRLDAQHGFSTPTLYQPKGKPAQVIVSGSYQVTGYSAATGERLWWVDGMAWQAKSVPVVAGDMLYVYSWMMEVNELVKLPPDTTWQQYLAQNDKDKDGAISKEDAPDKEMVKYWFMFDLDRSGKIEEKDFRVLQARNTAKTGLFAIQLGGSGDITKTAIRWKAEKSLPNIPSPLLYDGVLYILKEGGILTSYDPKTGAVLKQGRVEGALGGYYASPVAGDGKIYTVSQQGVAAVLKPGAQWEIAGAFPLEEDTWSTPALDDGRLYLRTQKAIYCFGK
jgi:outer membrane protein assembly factor BamB